MSLDNREALAYVVFCEMGCSRDKALATVDKLSEMLPAIGRLLQKRWRRKRRAANRSKVCP